MAEAGAPSGKRPRRASARLEVAAEAALPRLLRTLAGDPLRAILKLLGGAAARGTSASATALRVEGTSKRCGTRTSTAARGTKPPATALLTAGISRCCGSRTSTAARGTAVSVTMLRLEGTSRCCGTLTSTAARGTTGPAGVLLR
jgi:hypothetical protein